MNIIISLTFVLVISLASAQVTSQEPSEIVESAEISIVALGPKPPRKYAPSGDGDGPIMLLPKHGESPPSRLYYEGKSADGKRAWVSLNLPFNSPSIMLKVPAKQPLELHQKIRGEDAYVPYVSIPALPSGSRMIFILQPSRFDALPWKTEPSIDNIDLLSINLKGKQFILKNLSNHKVYHAFDDSVKIVQPKEIIAYERPMTSELYRLIAAYGNKKIPIYNTAVRLNDDSSVHLYILFNDYPATNAGREVGVFRTMISTAKTPLNLEVSPED